MRRRCPSGIFRKAEGCVMQKQWLNISSLSLHLYSEHRCCLGLELALSPGATAPAPCCAAAASSASGRQGAPRASSSVPGSSCQNSSCIPGGVECSGRAPGLFFQEASCERAELSPVMQQAEPECLWDQEQSRLLRTVVTAKGSFHMARAVSAGNS